MKEVKTAELIGAALDWAVAKAIGLEVSSIQLGARVWVGGLMPAGVMPDASRWSPSTDWSQGGPLIERRKITVVCCEGDYNPSKSGTPDCYDTYWVTEIGRQNAGTVYGPQSDNWGDCFQIDAVAMQGPTPLIAAMRCLVASEMGDTVQVPEELL